MKESFVFSEFARRLNNIVRFGTVAEVNHKKARVRVKIGNITTAWIPWCTTAGAVKIWNPPVVGEQVSVISQGGDLSLAVAIPSIFQNKFSAPSSDENVLKLTFSDKSSIEFNKKSDEFLIKIGNSEAFFSNDKIKFSVGMSKIEMTPEKISIHAQVVDIPSLKVGL